MDKLSTSIILLLVLFYGSDTAFLCLAICIMFGFAPIDHITMLSLCGLFTCAFYGALGLVYIAFSLLVIIGCAFMYWYDFSLDTVLQKLAEMQTPANTSDTLVTQSNDKCTLSRYIYTKLGVSDARIEKNNAIYNGISHRFDAILCYMWQYCVKFRQITEHLIMFNKIYYIYDLIISAKNSIETIKALHKASRSFDISMFGAPFLSEPDLENRELVTNSDSTKQKQELVTKHESDGLNVVDLNNQNDKGTEFANDCDDCDDFDILDEPTNKKSNRDAPISTNSSEEMKMNPNDINKMMEEFGGMPDLLQMQKKLDNLPESEKQKLAKMTQDMLKNIDMTEMMKSFGNIQGMKNGLTKRHGSR